MTIDVPLMCIVVNAPSMDVLEQDASWIWSGVNSASEYRWAVCWALALGVVLMQSEHCKSSTAKVALHGLGASGCIAYKGCYLVSFTLEVSFKLGKGSLQGNLDQLGLQAACKTVTCAPKLCHAQAGDPSA